MKRHFSGQGNAERSAGFKREKIMNVVLLSYTPEPELNIANAARLCYSGATIDEVREKLTPEKTAAFLDMLSGLGHESPIEHASFTFGIEGVSRALLAQITRHRIASFSVQSQRYVKEDQFEYVTPPEIENDPEAKKVFIEAMERSQEYYDRLTEELKAKHKARLILAGEDEKSAERAAEKQAIEDARFVLPNACCTKMIVTMNARSLYNFFSHRCCNRAQWEIRCLAEKMLMLGRDAAPHLCKKAGPACRDGRCPEGKMSCKRAAEMREKYAVKD